MKFALITNPTSGKGRGATYGARAAAALSEHGEVLALQGADAPEATALAHEAVANGVDALVVVGGDGMVNLATQVVAGTNTPLGIIPAGTGNDVARYFDLPLRDPVAAARRVASMQPRQVDLARVGDRYFVTVLAAGFDALVNERANQMTWPKGQMRYNLATVLELGKLAPLTYEATMNGQTTSFSATMVAVGNGPSFGGGLKITDGADLSDGLLDVLVVAPVSRRRLLRIYPRLFKGTHLSEPECARTLTPEITLSSPGITAYADGERLGPLPLTVRCEPLALRVLV